MHIRKNLALLMAAVLGICGAAQAAELEDRPFVEIYGGYYSGGSNEFGTGADIDLEGGLTLGLRTGGHLNQRWAVEVSAGWVPGAVDAPLSPSMDADIWLAEGSVHYFFNPDGKAVFSLFAGPGWISVSPDTGQSESGFTMHAGAALKFLAGEHFYIRPDIRYRWVKDLNLGGLTDDRLDTFEGSVAMGWLF